MESCAWAVKLKMTQQNGVDGTSDRCLSSAASPLCDQVKGMEHQKPPVGERDGEFEDDCRRGQSGTSTAVTVAAPDGGWGWVVLLATIVVMALTLAFPSCVGIFYTDLQNDFHADNSQTSWVPSIMISVLHAGGKVLFPAPEKVDLSLLLLFFVINPQFRALPPGSFPLLFGGGGTLPRWGFGCFSTTCCVGVDLKWIISHGRLFHYLQTQRAWVHKKWPTSNLTEFRSCRVVTARRACRPRVWSVFKVSVNRNKAYFQSCLSFTSLSAKQICIYGNVPQQNSNCIPPKIYVWMVHWGELSHSGVI